jgi:alpha-L-fucosidase
LNKTGDVPEDMLRHGVENGDAWVPAEVNTSIRPEWFYHPKRRRQSKNAAAAYADLL